MATTEFTTPAGAGGQFLRLARQPGRRRARHALAGLSQPPRAVARLLVLDDRMLRDIGVTRGDVHAAMASPISDDPSRHLAGARPRAPRAPSAPRYAEAERARAPAARSLTGIRYSGGAAGPLEAPHDWPASPAGLFLRDRCLQPGRAGRYRRRRHGALRFPHPSPVRRPRACSRRAARARPRSRPTTSSTSSDERRRRAPGLQRPRRRMARDARQRGRKSHALVVGERQRPQPDRPDLDYLFAPLKQARLDYMVEQGGRDGRRAPPPGPHPARPGDPHQPPAHGSERHRGGRAMRHPRHPHDRRAGAAGALLDAWPEAEPGRRIVFCDEGHDRRRSADDPVAPSTRRRSPCWSARKAASPPTSGARLRALPFVTPLPLGPRILRADTAAVAALALVQAALGDWRIASQAPT